MRARPINIASQEVTRAIMEIEPSRTEFNEELRPCSLRLVNGLHVPRVICQENPRWSDKGEWIDPETIVEVQPSLKRLPPRLAEKLYRAGESGMGYLVYVMELRSGRRLLCLTGGIVDFPGLPDAVSTNDICEVYPHEGRDRLAREPYLADAEFEFCDFLPWGKKEPFPGP